MERKLHVACGKIRQAQLTRHIIHHLHDLVKIAAEEVRRAVAARSKIGHKFVYIIFSVPLRRLVQARIVHRRRSTERLKLAQRTLEHIVYERAEHRRVKFRALPRLGFQPVAEEKCVAARRKAVNARSGQAQFRAVKPLNSRLGKRRKAVLRPFFEIKHRLLHNGRKRRLRLPCADGARGGVCRVGQERI